MKDPHKLYRYQNSKNKRRNKKNDLYKELYDKG